MALNALDKERYIQHGGVSCPFCGSEDIEGGFVETSEGYAFQPITCKEEGCGKKWKDIYILSDLEEEV